MNHEHAVNLYIPVAAVFYGDRVRKATGSTEPLERSMREIGQTAPIMVQTSGAGYLLITGARRLEAAKNLGWQMIAAYVAHPDTDATKRRRAEVEDNLTVMPYTTAEIIEASWDTKLPAPALARKLHVSPGKVAAALRVEKALHSIDPNLRTRAKVALHLTPGKETERLVRTIEDDRDDVILEIAKLEAKLRRLARKTVGRELAVDRGFHAALNDLTRTVNDVYRTTVDERLDNPTDPHELQYLILQDGGLVP